MSATKNDGGPAYPLPRGSADLPEPQNGCAGMSLRDWFAAMALQGDIASESEGFLTKDKPDGTMTREQALAIRAYRIADAMLAERNK